MIIVLPSEPYGSAMHGNTLPPPSNKAPLNTTELRWHNKQTSNPPDAVRGKHCLRCAQARMCIPHQRVSTPNSNAGCASIPRHSFPCLQHYNPDPGLHIGSAIGTHSAPSDWVPHLSSSVSQLIQCNDAISPSPPLGQVEEQALHCVCLFQQNTAELRTPQAATAALSNCINIQPGL